MSASNDTSKESLSDYETEQVRRIAAWKSEPTNPIAEIFKMVVQPGARLIGRLIPDKAARASIEKAYDLSALLAGQDDVKRQAGVHELGAMRHKPLEECDRLATRVGVGSQTIAVAEGAATGAGGPLTTVIDIPLLFVLAMRTILKIGHCYSYPLDRPDDRKYTLAVLVTAMSGSLATRRKRLTRLRELEGWVLDEAEQDLVAEEIQSFLFQLEVFEEVPGVGAISGALLNLALIRRVDVTARRVFQERWLRDNGKVDEIAPAAVAPRVLATGWSGAWGRAAYAGSYYLSFGAALPAWFLVAMCRPLGAPLARGLHDGTAAASAGVDRLLGWAGRELPAMGPARERVRP